MIAFFPPTCSFTKMNISQSPQTFVQFIDKRKDLFQLESAKTDIEEYRQQLLSIFQEDHLYIFRFAKVVANIALY